MKIYVPGFPFTSVFVSLLYLVSVIYTDPMGEKDKFDYGDYMA